MKRAMDLTYVWLLRIASIWAWLIGSFLVARAMNSEHVFYPLAGGGFVLLFVLSLTILR